MPIKIVRVFLKHDDRTSLALVDENNAVCEEMDSDYLPHVGVFGGDQTDMEIDNETGRIIGWVPIETLKE